MIICLNCFLSSTIKTPLPYPFNYGYFPNTLGEDGEPLDAILLTNHSLVPGCIIECSIIGAIEMIDNGEVDTKILVIPKKWSALRLLSATWCASSPGRKRNTYVNNENKIVQLDF